MPDLFKWLETKLGKVPGHGPFCRTENRRLFKSGNIDINLNHTKWLWGQCSRQSGKFRVFVSK